MYNYCPFAGTFTDVTNPNPNPNPVSNNEVAIAVGVLVPLIVTVIVTCAVNIIIVVVWRRCYIRYVDMCVCIIIILCDWIGEKG